MQEHLALLRSLCVRFPARFAELSPLAAADIEVDFFANVAHLQMHRRVRALHRLTKAGGTHPALAYPKHLRRHLLRSLVL